MKLDWKTKKKLKQMGLSYLFLAPAIVLLLIFTFYPIAYGVILGFYDFNMLRHDTDGHPAPPKWVGLDNFHRILKDPYFYISLKNSLLYLIVVPIIQLAAILMAILVNRNMKGVTWFRTAYYIPVVTSIVIVGIAWKWVLGSDGILNFFLVKKFHIFAKAIPWLTDSSLALFSVMFVTLWQGIGYYMVLYLAGLQTIPPEFEEAAKLDGASPFTVFKDIILPLLKPTVALCTIISCISALKVFGEIFVMTGGGPENGTLTMVYYIYNKAFNEFDMGYAAALALVLALFVGAISFINIAFFKKGGLQYY
ncbi:MAG: sugar ABC transporter permease [Firmicutes bacterium]|nr:sugar ABC transporter permease [Bacillota bacterium]